MFKAYCWKASRGGISIETNSYEMYIPKIKLHQRENKFAGIVLSFLLIQLLPCLTIDAYAQHDTTSNICAYLGGRADKNFLGSGNLALVIEPSKTKVLFVQQWKEKGLFDWASGTVRSWYPDRIEMKEAMPPLAATISHSPISRKIFVTRMMWQEWNWYGKTIRQKSY